MAQILKPKCIKVNLHQIWINKIRSRRIRPCGKWHLVILYLAKGKWYRDKTLRWRVLCNKQPPEIRELKARLQLMIKMQIRERETAWWPKRNSSNRIRIAVCRTSMSWTKTSASINQYMKSTPPTWTQTFLSHLLVSRWTSFLTSKKSKINRCQYMIWTLVSSNSSKREVSIYKWNSVRMTNDFTLWRS